MLTIRPEQMEAFKRAAPNHFEDRLLRHLRHYFPEVCERLGEDGVRRGIRYGMDRVRPYGLTTERQLARYMNLQFAFGLHFDEELPWAAAILGDLEEPADIRLDRLSEDAARFASEARGLTPEELGPATS